MKTRRTTVAKLPAAALGISLAAVALAAVPGRQTAAGPASQSYRLEQFPFPSHDRGHGLVRLGGVHPTSSQDVRSRDTCPIDRIIHPPGEP